MFCFNLDISVMSFYAKGGRGREIGSKEAAKGEEGNGER